MQRAKQCPTKKQSTWFLIFIIDVYIKDFFGSERKIIGLKRLNILPTKRASNPKSALLLSKTIHACRTITILQTKDNLSALAKRTRIIVDGNSRNIEFENFVIRAGMRFKENSSIFVCENLCNY